MIHVAVGIILNAEGHILVAERAQHKHQGGMWEFPGGKVETGESVFEALRRELLERLTFISQKLQRGCSFLTNILTRSCY